MKDENEPFGGFLNEACDANREIGRLQAIIDDLNNSNPECMEAIYRLDIIKLQAEVDRLRAVIAANPNCIAFQAKISELEKAK
jgi:hypothetical protein